MSPESSLKVLVALNAVQMFITVLLVAILVSSGLSARSSQSVSMADLAAMNSANPANNPSFSPSAGAFPSAPEPNPAAMAPAAGEPGSGPPPGEGVPPGAPPSNNGAPPPPSGNEPPPPEASTPVVSRDTPPAQEQAAESKATATLRSYLSLVSRRLDLAARASGVDPKPFLPSTDDLKAAVSSEDPNSEDFKKVTAQLKKGYEAMGLEFPDLPTLPSGGP